jgi:hypothetical protein
VNSKCSVMLLPACMACACRAPAANLCCLTHERSLTQERHSTALQDPDSLGMLVAACAQAILACRAVSFVRCSKLGSGRAVMVGDAAHAFSPNLGCGAASGMQDGVLLAACVAKHLEAGLCLDGIAETWTESRIADAHAYTRISYSLAELQYYPLHKSLLRLVKALPVGGIVMLTFVISSLPLPGAEAPLHAAITCSTVPLPFTALLCTGHQGLFRIVRGSHRPLTAEFSHDPALTAQPPSSLEEIGPIMLMAPVLWPYERHCAPVAVALRWPSDNLEVWPHFAA